MEWIDKFIELAFIIHAGPEQFFSEMKGYIESHQEPISCELSLVNDEFGRIYLQSELQIMNYV